MSGVDGLSDRLRRVFCQPSVYGTTVVALIPVGNQNIQLLLLQAEADSWRIVQSVREPLSILAPDRKTFAGDFRDAFADAASLRLAQLGWTDWPRVLVNPDTEAVSYVMSLPAGMELAERTEAAYWELVARLSEQRIEIGQCCTAGAVLPTTGDFWIAAVQQEDIQLWQQPFIEAEIPLRDFVMMAPMVSDLSVDGRIPGPGFCSLLQANSVDKGCCWDYRALAAVWLGVLLLGLAAFTGWDCWQLYAARQETARLQQTLSELAPDQLRMEQLESVRQDIDVREKQLRMLSEKNFPWYSVLIHFGSMTTEGAWLDSLKLEGEDTLHLQGHAVSFEALADYIKAFEQDKGFFPQGPVLESSGIDKNRISFRMTLHL